MGSIRAGGRDNNSVMHVLSGKVHWQSEDWFLFSRPLLLLVKGEEKCLDIIGR